jgi:hypothetical protein
MLRLMRRHEKKQGAMVTGEADRGDIGDRPRFPNDILTIFVVCPQLFSYLDRAPFPAPAASNAACGFPALRFPVGFASRVSDRCLVFALT